MATWTPPSLASFAARSFEIMPPRPSALLPLHCASNSGVSLRMTRLNLRLLSSVGNKEPIHIRKQEQPVGFHCCGQQRAQFVVITESAFEFAHRNAVVLVYDRDDSQAQQLRERVLKIPVANRRGEIVTGKQQLRDDLSCRKTSARRYA